MRVLLLCMIVAAAGAGVALRAQQPVEYSDDAETLFARGVKEFSAGADQAAAVTFGRVIAYHPRSQRVTAAYVMRGKALFRSGENLECAKVLKTFLGLYPASTYVPDADLMLGQVYERIGRHEEALQALLESRRLLTAESPRHLVHEIGAAIDSVVDRDFSPSALARFVRESQQPDERALLWLKIAEREIALQNVTAAAIALDSLTQRYGGSGLQPRMAALRSRIAMRSSIKLGVLLPLMRSSEPSAMKEIGNEVYDGILFAFEHYVADPSARVKVVLETRDTEREVSLAIRGMEDLASDKDVVGVIGPVFSATTLAAARVAATRGIPMITPTANANGIAAAGPTVFQANPDYETRGRVMARYAVADRKLSTLAVLAPRDSYGRFLAEAFIKEATRLGARVVATEWYERGTSDLKSQLRALREAGLKAAADPSIPFGGKLSRQDMMKLVDLGVPVKRIDSLLARGSIVSSRWLLGPGGPRAVDSLGIAATLAEILTDSLEIPVQTIEGLYIPISGPEEIGVVTSQVVYFNFRTEILGSGEWNNFGELNANRRYCTKVIFESDTAIDSADTRYEDFTREFAARFKKRPSRNTLYGYDTAELVLHVIRNGATTREAVARALAAVGWYRGIHAAVGFSPGRVNTHLSILQFNGEVIRKIADISADAGDARQTP
jgi:ABC-type branched-subunit amino acid transport system substrate-binding protein